MKRAIVFLACAPILTGCATEAETAVTNATIYQYCVSESQSIGADPVIECGPDVASFQPSFGQRYRYLQAQYRAQQAQRTQQVRQQAAQRPYDPCFAVWAAEIGGPNRTPFASESYSRAQRAYLACRGAPVPPDSPPPIIVEQPEQQPSSPQHITCYPIGTAVMCDSF